MRKRAVVGGVTAAVLVAGAAGAGSVVAAHRAGEGGSTAPPRPRSRAFARAWRERSFTTPGHALHRHHQRRRPGTTFTKATAGLGLGTGHGHRRRPCAAPATARRPPCTSPGPWPGASPWSLRRAGHRPARRGRRSRWADRRSPRTTRRGTPQLETGDHPDGHPHVGRPRHPARPGRRGPRPRSARSTRCRSTRPAPPPPPSRELEKVVDEPAGSLVAKLAAATKAGSKAPIPVITYRQADFDERKAALDALKGVIYPAREQPLAKSRTFAQPLLGFVRRRERRAHRQEQGPVCRGRLRRGQRPPGAVRRGARRHAPGSRSPRAPPRTPRCSPRTRCAGKDVVDDPVPERAGRRRDRARRRPAACPSALVAVDVKTGDVLASANSPALGFDRAMTGHYPPGSAFKIATTYALLTVGQGHAEHVGHLPEELRRRRPVLQELRGRVARHPGLHHRLRPLVQHGVRRSSRPSSPTTTWPRPPTRSASPAGPRPSASPTPSTPASPPTTARPTRRRPRSGRAATSPHRWPWRCSPPTWRAGRRSPRPLVTDPAVAGADRAPKPLDAKVVGQLRTLMGEVVSRGHRHRPAGARRAARSAARPARRSSAPRTRPRRTRGSSATRATSRSRCSSRRARAAAASPPRSPRTFLTALAAG